MHGNMLVAELERALELLGPLCSREVWTQRDQPDLRNAYTGLRERMVRTPGLLACHELRLSSGHHLQLDFLEIRAREDAVSRAVYFHDV